MPPDSGICGRSTRELTPRKGRGNQGGCEAVAADRRACPRVVGSALMTDEGRALVTEQKESNRSCDRCQDDDEDEFPHPDAKHSATLGYLFSTFGRLPARIRGWQGPPLSRWA